MQFTVPKFIEMETKIVGPLTFKQFLVIGSAGVICFILYYALPFSTFLISSILLLALSSAFAFLQIGGRSLLAVFGNFLKFSVSPKIHLWRKKGVPITFLKKVEIKKEKEGEEELPLKIAEKSQLKKIKIQIETRPK